MNIKSDTPGSFSQRAIVDAAERVEAALGSVSSGEAVFAVGFIFCELIDTIEEAYRAERDGDLPPDWIGAREAIRGLLAGGVHMLEDDLHAEPKT